MQDPTGTEPLMTGRAANVARRIAVDHQTITINGQPQWIATVPIDQLQRAADHLRRIRQKHENRATAILGGVLMLWFVLILVLAKTLPLPTGGGSYTLPALVIIAGMLPTVVWFASYSEFRLQRLTMHVIERRWAEIQTELVIREANPASPNDGLTAEDASRWNRWAEHVRRMIRKKSV